LPAAGALSKCNWDNDFLDVAKVAHLTVEGKSDCEIAFGALKGLFSTSATAANIPCKANHVLSVVPAEERPVSGAGQAVEHVAGFGLVTVWFALGHRYSLIRLWMMDILFCGVIELLPISPADKARQNSVIFLIDALRACFAIFCVVVAGQIGHRILSWGRKRRFSTQTE
jgi:hypothetical protein